MKTICALIIVFFVSVRAKPLLEVQGLNDRANLDSNFNGTISRKIIHLNDPNVQLMVHFVGNGSNVIIYLTQNPASAPYKTVDGTNKVYISYDYGDSYEDKTHLLKLKNGNLARINKFFFDSKYESRIVFTDVVNNVIFMTKDYGKTITRTDLDFTPNDILFHQFLPDKVLAVQKSPSQLWMTEDFGSTWSLWSGNVNSFFWSRDGSQEPNLVLYSTVANNISYISDLKSHESVVLASNVLDVIYKEGDYIFFTSKYNKDSSDLFVSHKLGTPTKCVFDTSPGLITRDFYIVDVTSTRALVVVGHTDALSHLYVSEDLNKNGNEMRFYLSLEGIMSHFPKKTWQSKWLGIYNDVFADVYRVRGVNGVYIASQLTVRNYLDVAHLVTLITYDHGTSWRRLNAPVYDSEGNRIECALTDDCSLHLHQHFSHIHPKMNLQSILSSQSAPGVIIATGVIGTSLKGHPRMFISTDAGLTWYETLKSAHLFQIGNYGGILTAVEYNENVTTTRHMLYSTNFGKNWTRVAFHYESLRVYSLLTEPGETTAVFSLFTSAVDAHRWTIVKLDLTEIFSYKCVQSDFEEWSPSQVACTLGQQATFLRKMANSTCYTDHRELTEIRYETCPCDAVDFQCDSGFFRSGNLAECIRNKNTSDKPYNPPATCEYGQFYNRTKGYRKVTGSKCVSGSERQYLPDSVSCSSTQEEFLLIGLREKIGRFDLINNTWEILPIENLTNVIAVEFDMKNRCVYWSDIGSKTIGRQCSNNAPEEFLAGNLTLVEGIALDWISRNLYFVDGERAKIEMVTIDRNPRVRRTILDSKHLKQPRGIAVHPIAGYLFWTDWSLEQPAVSRSALDGSDVRVLFDKKFVHWPNDITIDFIAERIYWVDAREDYVGRSDFHGNHFKKIISKNSHVSHPFSIAVFKDNVYWNDWFELGVFRGDKDNDLEITLLKEFNRAMGVKLYGHGLQEGVNECINSTCSDICVSTPEQGHKCLCADGMELEMNKCVCSKNKTCSELDNVCPVTHLTCDNGICVPKELRCNSRDDCGDGSDEIHCSPKNKTQSTPTVNCDGYFKCANGQCITRSWRCNGSKDCTDGSDEKNCTLDCSQTEFACSDICISLQFRCDGDIDCHDGSDETNCEEPKTCKSDEFRCNQERRCIPDRLRCNGKADCTDGSDEINCSPQTCPQNQFRCEDGRCIPAQWRCDSDVDCIDKSDELDCNSTKCNNSTEFRCTKDSRCIPLSWRCDGEADCLDGSDEPSNCNQGTKDTTNNSCLAWQFKCTNDKCVPSWWKCDLENDCGDNSDEVNCGDNTTLHPMLSVNRNCSENQHKCLNTTKCIPITDVCNGRPDCPSGTDELQCSSKNYTTPTLYCDDDYFRCDITSCVPTRWRCDGDQDCKDGSDEENCPRGCMDSALFDCDDNRCIPKHWKCDGESDCQNGADERDCDVQQLNSTNCTSEDFHCTQGNQCFKSYQRCDGTLDCPDGTDELNCPPATCPQGQFRCGDGHCIHTRWRCDDDFDCNDRSDEKDCPPSNSTCAAHQFRCSEDGGCIHLKWRCDGVFDCRNGSDELNCSNNTQNTTVSNV